MRCGLSLVPHVLVTVPQYYSALEGNPRHYLMARAIQFWTPGIPMVYYVGLLAGRNDHKVKPACRKSDRADIGSLVVTLQAYRLFCLFCRNNCVACRSWMCYLNSIHGAHAVTRVSLSSRTCTGSGGAGRGAGDKQASLQPGGG